VALHLFNDIFLLHFALKSTQSVLDRLAFLQSDFCQRNNTPKLVQRDCIVIARFGAQVKFYVLKQRSRMRNAPHFRPLRVIESSVASTRWGLGDTYPCVSFVKSKHHFQGELHLPWRERIRGLQGVSGDLVVSGIIVDP
jgi:hypothetical protein